MLQTKGNYTVEILIQDDNFKPNKSKVNIRHVRLNNSIDVLVPAIPNPEEEMETNSENLNEEENELLSNNYSSVY